MYVTNVLKLVCMLVLIFDRNYLLKKQKQHNQNPWVGTTP